MRDFAGITNQELNEKIQSMAHSELGESLNELMKRQIQSYREDCDQIDTLQALHILQGRIGQLKDLRSLFQPKAVPRKGQQGE